MKILVIGGSGFIGWELVKFFSLKNHDVSYTYLKNNPKFEHGFKQDITNKKTLKELFNKIQPELVIYTTALTNVDLCEIDNSLAYSIHVQGTQNVVEACQDTRSKLIYISTSFVFNGSKHPFFEYDVISPTTYYGITKAEGEKIVKESGLLYLILRTDQPYGWKEEWNHYNSVIRVVENLRSGKEHKEIVDWYNTPTYVPDFVSSVEKLIKLKETGIFHLVGSDYVSRYDWALTVAEIFNLNKSLIIPISSKDLNLSVKRDNVYLSNEKLFQKTGIRMNGIKEGILDMLQSTRD
jgi:dTDP-4-dehydrorhamnose reductase